MNETLVEMDNTRIFGEEKNKLVIEPYWYNCNRIP